VSGRNPSIEDIPEVYLDESMRFAATKEIDLRRKREMLAAHPTGPKLSRRRDDSMAAALQKVVDKHRSTLLLNRTKPNIVMLDQDPDAKQELLDRITAIQRFFRKGKVEDKENESGDQDPEKFDSSRHRTAVTISTEVVAELKKDLENKEKKGEKKHVHVSYTKLLAMREKRDPNSELPIPGVDEVWDVITRRYGGVRSHATLVDVVDLFHACKLAGLNIDLARFPGLWPARNAEPEDVSPGEVAHLCIMLLEDVDEELTCAQVREAIDCVKEECRATAYKDLYIGNDDSHEYLNFSHFKRLIYFLSDLMGIDEQYILGTFMYLCVGTFEMTDLFAALVMKEMGKKQKWKGKKNTHGTDLQESLKRENSCTKKKKREKAAKSPAPFEGCAVEDIQNLLNQKFSNVDFSRMCYNCQILDPRNGISYSRLGETFLQTARHMGKLMKDRVAKRPILHKEEDRWEEMMMKYDTPSFLFDGVDQDKTIALCFTIGRSEFSVLMEALYGILPKTWFGGPLDMCLKLLLKIRAREEARGRDTLRIPSGRIPALQPTLQKDASGNTTGHLKSQSSEDSPSHLIAPTRTRSRSPSEEKSRSPEKRSSSRSPSARSSRSSRHSSRSKQSSRSTSPVRHPQLPAPSRLEVPEVEEN